MPTTPGFESGASGAPATAPRYFAYKAQVPLTGGATLAFEKGKGYYAKPPVQVAMSPAPTRTPAPAPPTLLDQAGTQAQQEIDAQTAPIDRKSVV